MKRLGLILSLLALTAAACSGDDGGESSTTASTTSVAPVTSLGASATTTETTVPDSSTATTTTEPGEVIDFPTYTIVSREEGEAGDTVVVLLDTDSYDSLTDIDLANVLADVVERFPPILTAYVVDDAAASTAVLAAEPTAEQVDLLDRHYLVRLEEGFRMVFAGPFEDTPIAILGS